MLNILEKTKKNILKYEHESYDFFGTTYWKTMIYVLDNNDTGSCFVINEKTDTRKLLLEKFKAWKLENDISKIEKFGY